MEINEFYDFFCSYESKSKQLVKKIVDSIRSKDYTVWLDQDALYNLVGEDLHKKLAEGILESDFFISFISKLYTESYNCGLEYKYALSKKKQAIFILLDREINIPLDLDLYKSTSIRLDYFKEDEEVFLQRLLDSIDRLKKGICRKEALFKPVEDEIIIKAESEKYQQEEELLNIELESAKESDRFIDNQNKEQQSVNKVILKGK